MAQTSSGAHGPDDDVLGAAGPQRERPRATSAASPATERPRARGHAEGAGNDGERDRDDVGAPHGSTVVETPRADVAATAK